MGTRLVPFVCTLIDYSAVPRGKDAPTEIKGKKAVLQFDLGVLVDMRSMIDGSTSTRVTWLIPDHGYEGRAAGVAVDAWCGLTQAIVDRYATTEAGKQVLRDKLDTLLASSTATEPREEGAKSTLHEQFEQLLSALERSPRGPKQS